MPSEQHPIVKVSEFVMSAETATQTGVAGNTAAATGEQQTEAGRLSWRFYVVYETDLGDVLMSEKLPDGVVAWAENPVDMEERYAQSRVLRVADCSKTALTVGDVRKHLQKNVTAIPLSHSSRRYARDAFNWADGVLTSKSGIGQALRPPEVLRRPGYQY